MASEYNTTKSYDFCNIMYRAVINYSVNHMKNKWALMLLKINKDFKQILNDSDTDFQCVHIITNPVGDLMFDSTIPQIKYLTFCFLKTKKNPDSLYAFFSDHKDGVYKRLCESNGNKYIIDEDSFCIIGKNNISDQIITNILKNKNPEYLNIDWATGKLISHVNTLPTNLVNNNAIIFDHKITNDSEKKISDNNTVHCHICHKSFVCKCIHEQNISPKYRSCAGENVFPTSQMFPDENGEIELIHVCSKKCQHDLGNLTKSRLELLFKKHNKPAPNIIIS
jgi:hypothetical protein